MRPHSHRIAESFRLDARSLAAFRIAVPLLIVTDVAMRFNSAQGLLSADGVVPWSLVRTIANPWILTTFGWVGAIPQPSILLGILALAALGLCLGWRTRLMTFICWIGVCALQTRNPLVMTVGDTILRLSLFWSLFLPLNGIWTSHPSRQSSVLSAASVAYVVQLCLAYWVAAALKTAPSWINDFTALEKALHLAYDARPWTQALLAYPRFLKVATAGALIFEWLGPLLILIPWRSEKWRLATVLGFMAFHLVGIASLMKLGIVCWAFTIAWIPLLPGVFWNSLGIGVSTESKEPNRRDPFPVNAFVTTCLIYVIIWNAAALPQIPVRKFLPKGWSIPGYALRLDQFWFAFTPAPPDNDGWYVVETILKDNRIVDAWRGGHQISWDKPDDIASVFPDVRWRKYLISLLQERNAPYRIAFTDYLCRSWNAVHHDANTALTVTAYYVYAATERRPQAPPQLVASSVCSK